jgi:hypothetical protein
VIMTSGMVAARYLATITTSMTSMMHPVAAIFDHTSVCTSMKQVGDDERRTKNRVQCCKRKCHVDELHVLTKPVGDISHICADEEIERCSASFAKVSSGHERATNIKSDVPNYGLQK